mgnify:CR=1 FL=1
METSLYDLLIGEEGIDVNIKFEDVATFVFETHCLMASIFGFDP